MRNYVLVMLMFMFSCITAYGDYAFEVVSDNQEEKVSEAQHVKASKVDMNNVIENYKKVMSNDNNVFLIKNQLSYNIKREKDIAGEINKLEKQLETLPKIVKREYRQFDHMLESTDAETADNTWISFEDAFNKRQKELEDRILILKGDLVVVRTRSAKLKLELETMETMSHISNPFVKTDSEENENSNAKRASRARNNLNDVVKYVTYNEAKDLLSDMPYNTIGLCEFSCGRSNCYVCNLLYGKKTK
jgi:hypothetical protein